MARSIAMATVAGLFLFALATGASAQMGGGRGSPTMGAGSSTTVNCAVRSVNTGSSSFTCGGGARGSQPFRVSSTTVFQLGAAGSSFGQLRAGMSVRVEYHNSDAGSVADLVVAAP